jgi:hypothetical protein
MGFVQKSGTSSDEVTVKNGKALTEAVSKSSAESAAGDKNAFIWTSTYTTSGAEVVAYIKNTSETDNLVIDKIILGSAAAQVWTVTSVTSGTPAGTGTTGVSTTLESAIAPKASSFGNAAVTGSVAGTAIGYTLTAAGACTEIDLLSSVVLTSNRDIAVSASGAGAVYVTIIGHYEA